MNWLQLREVLNFQEIKDLITAAGLLLLAMAAIGALLRIKKVIEALKAFRAAKSDINDLLDAVRELSDLLPKLRIAQEDLGDDVAKLMRAQEIGSEKAPEGALAEEDRWQKVREVWQGARDRIEGIIDGLDGRVRRPYNKMKRNTYVPIVEALRSDGHLSEKGAEAALRMNNRFLQLRPHPTSTTDNDVANFNAWKREFDAAAGAA